ncbi:uncharacterized protein LOC120340471 [Styela clava]
MDCGSSTCLLLVPPNPIGTELEVTTFDDFLDGMMELTENENIRNISELSCMDSTPEEISKLELQSHDECLESRNNINLQKIKFLVSHLKKIRNLITKVQEDYPSRIVDYLSSFADYVYQTGCKLQKRDFEDIVAQDKYIIDNFFANKYLWQYTLSTETGKSVEYDLPNAFTKSTEVKMSKTLKLLTEEENSMECDSVNMYVENTEEKFSKKLKLGPQLSVAKTLPITLPRTKQRKSAKKRKKAKSDKKVKKIEKHKMTNADFASEKKKRKPENCAKKSKDKTSHDTVLSKEGNQNRNESSDPRRKMSVVGNGQSAPKKKSLVQTEASTNVHLSEKNGKLISKKLDSHKISRKGEPSPVLHSPQYTSSSDLYKNHNTAEKVTTPSISIDKSRVGINNTTNKRNKAISKINKFPTSNKGHPNYDRQKLEEVVPAPLANYPDVGDGKTSSLSTNSRAESKENTPTNSNAQEGNSQPLSCHGKNYSTDNSLSTARHSESVIKNSISKTHTKNNFAENSPTDSTNVYPKSHAPLTGHINFLTNSSITLPSTTNCDTDSNNLNNTKNKTDTSNPTNENKNRDSSSMDTEESTVVIPNASPIKHPASCKSNPLRHRKSPPKENTYTNSFSEGPKPKHSSLREMNAPSDPILLSSTKNCDEGINDLTKYQGDKLLTHTKGSNIYHTSSNDPNESRNSANDTVNPTISKPAENDVVTSEVTKERPNVTANNQSSNKKESTSNISSETIPKSYSEESTTTISKYEKPKPIPPLMRPPSDPRKPQWNGNQYNYENRYFYESNRGQGSRYPPRGKPYNNQQNQYPPYMQIPPPGCYRYPTQYRPYNRHPTPPRYQERYY